MSCAPCEAQKIRTSFIPIGITTQSSNEDCPYTIEQINIWLAKVQCVKSEGLYVSIPNITKRQMNIYEGLLLSARNYATNICYFRNELEEIESFITVLTAMNLCQVN